MGNLWPQRGRRAIHGEPHTLQRQDFIVGSSCTQLSFHILPVLCVLSAGHQQTGLRLCARIGFSFRLLAVQQQRGRLPVLKSEQGAHATKGRIVRRSRVRIADRRSPTLSLSAVPQRGRLPVLKSEQAARATNARPYRREKSVLSFAVRTSFPVETIRDVADELFLRLYSR